MLVGLRRASLVVVRSDGIHSVNFQAPTPKPHWELDLGVDRLCFGREAARLTAA
jgi:hypothetical protein